MDASSHFHQISSDLRNFRQRQLEQLPIGSGMPAKARHMLEVSANTLSYCLDLEQEFGELNKSFTDFTRLVFGKASAYATRLFDSPAPPVFKHGAYAIRIRHLYEFRMFHDGAPACYRSFDARFDPRIPDYNSREHLQLLELARVPPPSAPEASADGGAAAEPSAPPAEALAAPASGAEEGGEGAAGGSGSVPRPTSPCCCPMIQTSVDEAVQRLIALPAGAAEDMTFQALPAGYRWIAVHDPKCDKPCAMMQLPPAAPQADPADAAGGEGGGAGPDFGSVAAGGSGRVLCTIDLCHDVTPPGSPKRKSAAYPTLPVSPPCVLSRFG